MRLVKPEENIVRLLPSITNVLKVRRDVYGGLLMIAFGSASIEAGIRYKPGTLTQMGSGFFPLMLGAALVLIGLLIILAKPRPEPLAAQSLGETPSLDARSETGEPTQPANEVGRFDGRSWLCIIAGLLAFVWVGKYGGLLPATFLVVFLSALGDRSNTLKSALILAMIMCAIAVGVFWWALKMQFPLFGWGAMQ